MSQNQLMGKNLIGVEAIGGSVLDVLERIDRLESLGTAAAWVSDGQIEFDALSLLAAAAERTEHIALGTGIVRTWPRHPVVTVQQSLTLAKLAPGRTRLGVGRRITTSWKRSSVSNSKRL